MKRSLQPLRSVLMNLCGEIGLAERMRLETLRLRWHEILGEPLSRHTYPVMIDKGSLIVNVDSPIWLQELKFAQAAFLEKLSGFSVATVRFRHGRTQWNPPPGHERTFTEKPGDSLPPAEPSTQDAAWIKDLTDNLSDPELRCLVRRTIARNLLSKSANRRHDGQRR